jgi:tetratricopeptide (TPR) repeat protein
MSDTAPEERRKRAFRLFEDGMYEESYTLCRDLVAKSPDPSLDVLAATNLYQMGRIDDAEVHFQDLAGRMPDSSYIHSYLAKIFEKKEDDRAFSEYARAIALDPRNQDALRSYSAYLIQEKDFRKAVPLLNKLCELSQREDDIRNLIHALTRSGRHNEAVRLCREKQRDRTGMECIDALLSAGDYTGAAELARNAFRNSGNRTYLKKYLLALSKSDPGTALHEYTKYCGKDYGIPVCLDYIRLLRSAGHTDDAILACSSLSGSGNEADHEVLLLEADLLAGAGEVTAALQKFGVLLREELRTLEDPDSLSVTLHAYRTFLLTNYPVRTATTMFLESTGASQHPVCLSSVGRLYEEIGDLTEARSWFYRAYRGDFLSGGLEYAKFLQRQGDVRECEKVMLYILNNVKKNSDLARVAEMIVDENGKMYKLPRLLERLISRLDSSVATLNTDALEYLAVALLVAGSGALRDQNYPLCKEYCLRGLDVLPFQSLCISTADFLDLIRTCKEKSLTDEPVLKKSDEKQVRNEPGQPGIAELLELDEREKWIVEFLKVHRTANELDLRKMLGTRRVAGMINRIVQKGSTQGIRVIERKGIGSEGEIYEYVGP